VGIINNILINFLIMAKISNGGESLLPQAFISVNKNRRKTYRGAHSQDYKNIVYLPNQSNFEIELFNPTSKRVGANLILNGVSSKNLLIVRPGERIFLDRHILDNKKLLFDVYEVSSENSDVQKAIEKNGVVRVEFYEENEEEITKIVDHICEPYCRGEYPHHVDVPASHYPYITWVGGYVPTHSTGDINTIRRKKYNPTERSCSVLSRPDNIVYYSTTTDTNNTNINVTYSQADTTISSDFLDLNNSYDGKLYSKKTIETGRVEKGEESKQKFSDVSFEAKYLALTYIEYKLLPISQKDLTNDDLMRSKMYCIKCGTKVNKSDIYCFKCGAKL
jgi:hypothetical protein